MLRRRGPSAVLALAALGSDCTSSPPAARLRRRPPPPSYLRPDGRSLWLTSPDDNAVVELDATSPSRHAHRRPHGGAHTARARGTRLAVSLGQSTDIALVDLSASPPAVTRVPVPCGGTRAVVAEDASASARVIFACPNDDLLVGRSIPPRGSSTRVVPSVGSPHRPRRRRAGCLPVTASRVGQIESRLAHGPRDAPLGGSPSPMACVPLRPSASVLDTVALVTTPGFAATQVRRARRRALGGRGLRRLRASLGQQQRPRPPSRARWLRRGDPRRRLASEPRLFALLRVALRALRRRPPTASGPSALAYATTPTACSGSSECTGTDNVLALLAARCSEACARGQRVPPPRKPSPRRPDESALTDARELRAVGSRRPAGSRSPPTAATAWVDEGFDHAVARLVLPATLPTTLRPCSPPPWSCDERPRPHGPLRHGARGSQHLLRRRRRLSTIGQPPSHCRSSPKERHLRHLPSRGRGEARTPVVHPHEHGAAQVPPHAARVGARAATRRCCTGTARFTTAPRSRRRPSSRCSRATGCWSTPTPCRSGWPRCRRRRPARSPPTSRRARRAARRSSTQAPSGARAATRGRAWQTGCCTRWCPPRATPTACWPWCVRRYARGSARATAVPARRAGDDADGCAHHGQPGRHARGDLGARRAGARRPSDASRRCRYGATGGGHATPHHPRHHSTKREYLHKVTGCAKARIHHVFRGLQSARKDAPGPSSGARVARTEARAGQPDAHAAQPDVVRIAARMTDCVACGSDCTARMTDCVACRSDRRAQPKAHAACRSDCTGQPKAHTARRSDHWAQPGARAAGGSVCGACRSVCALLSDLRAVCVAGCAARLGLRCGWNVLDCVQLATVDADDGAGPDCDVPYRESSRRDVEP